MRVMFEGGLHTSLACHENADPATTHLLQFENKPFGPYDGYSGFFYIKWDQGDLDKSEPYQAHLQEMLQEIMRIEPNQQVWEEPEFNLPDGYAILGGEPYLLITFSDNGESFLMGLAVKSENQIGIPAFYNNKLDIVNDLVKKIKWQKNI
jgi:hypothetical protein